MLPHILARALQEKLDTLIAALEEMLAILSQEYTALTSNDHETITHLASQKESVSSRIEQIELQRRDLLSTHELEFGKRGIIRLSKSIPRATLIELISSWQKITELGNTCSNQNQVNGVILQNMQRRAQTTLHILRGELAPDSTYSSRGLKQDSTSQHILGRI